MYLGRNLLDFALQRWYFVLELNSPRSEHHQQTFQRQFRRPCAAAAQVAAAGPSWAVAGPPWAGRILSQADLPCQMKVCENGFWSGWMQNGVLAEKFFGCL
jgi:hypothetical protein